MGSQNKKTDWQMIAAIIAAVTLCATVCYWCIDMVVNQKAQQANLRMYEVRKAKYDSQLSFYQKLHLLVNNLRNHIVLADLIATQLSHSPLTIGETTDGISKSNWALPEDGRTSWIKVVDPNGAITQMDVTFNTFRAELSATVSLGGQIWEFNSHYEGVPDEADAGRISDFAAYIRNSREFNYDVDNDEDKRGIAWPKWLQDGAKPAKKLTDLKRKIDEQFKECVKFGEFVEAKLKPPVLPN